MTETARDRIALRAHHLLCLHGFRGLGYDDRFVQNMAEICQRVQAEPGPEIVVTNEPDDICECCPHVPGCSCDEGSDAEARAKALDQRVLDRIGAQAGQVFDRDDIMALIYTKIRPEDLAVVCQECEWLPFDYCEIGLSKKKIEPPTTETG
jgi:uncharacterized protein